MKLSTHFGLAFYLLLFDGWLSGATYCPKPSVVGTIADATDDCYAGAAWLLTFSNIILVRCLCVR